MMFIKYAKSTLVHASERALQRARFLHVRWKAWFALAIKVFSMPYLYDPNKELFIVNRIDNSIQSLTDTTFSLP